MPNIWRLNNIILNYTWVKEEISREILKYFEWNENENTNYQNLQDVAKTVLREKFTALNACMRKKET